jgi:hypothetical protein
MNCQFVTPANGPKPGVCGEELIPTSECYLSCPLGHGKLIPYSSGKDRRDPAYNGAPAALKRWAKWQDEHEPPRLAVGAKALCVTADPVLQERADRSAMTDLQTILERKRAGEPWSVLASELGLPVTTLRGRVKRLNRAMAS